MQRQPDDFVSFIEGLSNKTVAIVYSFSNRVSPRYTWYDRWRSDVVLFHGEGVERLKAEPRYLDVELYLKSIASKDEVVGDYIINLHSGLLNVESWPIISANASWRQLPVAPCSSDVHIITERKDITNIVAATTALKVPEAWAGTTTGPEMVVVKPRDLGMSRGVIVKSRAEVRQEDLSRSVVQSFIPGLDATVSVLRLPSGDFYIVDAEIQRFSDADVTDIIDEATKISDRTAGIHTDRPISVRDDLAREIRVLCDRIGPSSIYRVDFRVVTDDGSDPSEMTLDNSYFLEVNSMPTVSRKSSYGNMIVNLMNDIERLSRDFGPSLAQTLRTLGPEGFYSAIILYNSATNLTSTIEHMRGWQ